MHKWLIALLGAATAAAEPPAAHACADHTFQRCPRTKIVEYTVVVDPKTGATQVTGVVETKLNGVAAYAAGDKLALAAKSAAATAAYAAAPWQARVQVANAGKQ
jgi:hypothetical protein